MPEPPGFDTPGADAVRTVATAFARAFDANDLVSIATLLAPDCELESLARRSSGRDRILEVYRDAHAWAERAFDEVRHESTVVRVDGTRAELDVTTYLLRVPGRWHRFRRVRELDVGDAVRVRRITDRVEPIARAELVAFAVACGAPPVPPIAFGTDG